MKPVVFVDVDGTVADSHAHWLELYNKDHSTHYTRADITEYDFRKILQFPMNVYYHDYEGVKFVAGAERGLSILSMFYRVVYVTAGYGREWLFSKIECRPEDFLQCPDRSLLRGFALIDDYPMNLDVFEGQRYLLEQPWNAGRGLNESDWYQITEHLIWVAQHEL